MPLIAALALVGCFGTRPSLKVDVVAGKPSDLMVVRHVVIRGTYEQIGEKLAILAQRNHNAKLSEVEPQTLHERLAWFAVGYPELLAKARGVRRAYSSAPKNADFTSLPYDLDVDPGCSVVYYPGKSVTNGHAMLSRNYDFPKAPYAVFVGKKPRLGARSMTGDPYVIEMHPIGGYASLYTCAYDLLQGTIDGVNEKGVTVALLADDMSKTRTRGRQYVGLGEVDLTRFVLDKARSAKQARRLLRDVPYYATFTPCHYIIGDPSGDSFIFEVGADGKHMFFDGDGKPQIVTNHAIAEYGTTKLPAGNSFERYRMLQGELAKSMGRYTPAEVKEINHCVAVPTNVRIAATLWHAVYDLTNRSVQISFCLSRAEETTERRTPYLSFHLGK